MKTLKATAKNNFFSIHVAYYIFKNFFFKIASRENLALRLGEYLKRYQA
jgi:hypothetical protein